MIKTNFLNRPGLRIWLKDIVKIGIKRGKMKRNLKASILMIIALMPFFFEQASAEDIKIGSISFTPVILIPIGIIILSIILILLLVFRADIAKKVREYYNKRAQKKKVEEDPLSAKKIEIINSYIQKLQTLMLKQKSMGDMMIWNKFSVIVRNFLKEFLEIEYEFTDAELIHELSRKRPMQRMIDIVKELDVRYSENITRKDIEDLERQFEQILYSLNTKEVRKFEGPLIKKPKKKISFV